MQVKQRLRVISLPLLCVVFSSVATFADSKCTESDTSNPVFGAECTKISVLENPTDQSSRSIALNVIHLPAIQETTKPPIFFIAGGPGQASTDLLDIFRLEFSSLLVDHDFIFVDQRGTGKSNPIHCDIELLPHVHKPPSEIEALTLNAHKECLKNYEANLQFYTTPYAVSDLEAVRKHFGYSHVFLWGGSYGTRVALEYLRSASDAIAGVILDGLAPFSIRLPVFAEYDSSMALAQLLATCQADPACNKAFPNLEKGWLTLLRKLKEKPRTEQLVHPRTQETHQVYIDDVVLSSVVRTILYTRDAAPILPLAIHNAVNEDFSTLFSISALGMDSMNESISSGMLLAVLCAEDFYLSQTEDTDIPSFTKYLHIPTSEYLEEICALYPASQLPKAYFSFPLTDTPALILSGQFDPVTPPRWGEEVAKHLSNNRHIIAEGGHHIISRAGCVPDIIKQFIQNPQNLSALDASCVSKIKPPFFFIDSAGPKLGQEASNHGDVK